MTLMHNTLSRSVAQNHFSVSLPIMTGAILFELRVTFVARSFRGSLAIGHSVSRCAGSKLTASILFTTGPAGGYIYL